MKVRGNGSCLYQAVATHIMLCCFDDVWTGRFTPGRKPGTKPATYEVMNDLKQIISQKDNTLLQQFFNFYATQGVDEFIKEKIEE